MNRDNFSEQIENLRSRVSKLNQHASESRLPSPDLLAIALEEISTALEELEVAKEELQQQNEELIATQQLVTAEHQRYQELFEFAPEGYLVTDAVGTITEVNRAAAKLLNISQQFIIGKPLIIFVVKQQRRDFHLKLTQQRQRSQIWEWEFCLQPRQRQPVNIALMVTDVRDRKGTLVGWRLCMRDITEHKRLDAALRHAYSDLEVKVQKRTADLATANEELRLDSIERHHAQLKISEQAALLDIATDVIFVCDRLGNILFWNKSAERLYGIKTAEALSKNANDIVQQNSPQLIQIHQTVEQDGKWHGELHQVAQDGKKIIVFSRWTLMRDAQGEPKSILVVNTDITEKTQLEALFLRNQRLQSLGTLASGIAHDLNNVLAPILLATQILQKKIPDGQNQQILKTIEAAARRGVDIVKQVLLFARGVEGKRTILQVRHIITEIRQIVKQTFSKSIEFSTDISADLWCISGDATQVHQVLINLCLNARDAMLDGGTLSISAENICIDEKYAKLNLDAQVGNYIVITVADTGTGISPEIIERIFEPFFTTKEIGKGTGLGLSTVIGIIKNHGGFVKVESSAAGTQIKVHLPAVLTIAAISAEENHDLPTGHEEVILVIDDEPQIREVTKVSLETYNYHVITANDGVEASALYSQQWQEISAVLVDMMMPQMDGIATIHRLQEINPLVKIIATSGLASNEKLAETASSSVKSFLLKPCTAKELLHTVAEVLSVK